MKYSVRFAPSEGDVCNLLQNIPERLMYFTPEFGRFITRATGGEYHVLGCYNGNDLLGILPFFVKKDQHLGTVVNSQPWFGSHGGCCVHSAASQEGVRRALLTGFADYLCATSDLLSAMVSLSPFEEPYSDVYAGSLPAHVVEPRNGQILHLPPLAACGTGNDEDILGALLGIAYQKTRNLVRKSFKQGFSYAVEDSDVAWNFLYTTHYENMTAIGAQAKDLRHIVALRQCFPQGMGRLHMCRLAGEPVAAFFALHYSPCVEYMLPVVKNAYRSLQPTLFLIYTALVAAVKEGYGYWNFGGTGARLTSLHHFKAGFGAVDAPYRYFCMIGAGGTTYIRENIDAITDCYKNYFIYPFSLLEL